LEANMSDFGIKRCTRLPLRTGFHTKLLKEDARQFAEAVSKTRVSIPRIPVMSNVSARPMKSEAGVRESLSKQLYSPAKLEQMLHELYSRPSEVGVPFSFECGPGNSMSVVLEKVNGRAKRQCVSVYS
jgi:[acyl-carrier-protein] S-malonyltransferase